MAKGVRRGTPTSHYDPATGYTIVDVQETDEGPAPGTAIKPLMEEYEGRNFPYRGTETHGVDPLYDVQPSPDKWEGGSVTVDMDKLEQEPEKVIPVRVVNEGSREIKEWRSYRVYATSRASILVGKFDARISFTLKNLSQDKTLYVGGDLQVSTGQGYPVPAGGTFTVESDTEVWGIAEDTTDIDVAVYVVYAVKVK